jgi:hypothetical protein
MSKPIPSLISALALAVIVPAQACGGQVDAKKKPDNAWKAYATRTIGDLAGFTSPSTTPTLSQFGGRLPAVSAAAGFFRCSRQGERWWLIDPQGCPFLNVGVVSVRPGKTPGSEGALKERFGTQERWAEETVGLLAANGFNGTGAWSETDGLRKVTNRLPYTLMWNFMSAYGKKRGGTFQQSGHTGYPNDCIFVFDPQFESFCDEYARQLAATKDDPWLIGHFSDNELPFKEQALDRYLELPEGDPGHQAALEWVRKRPGVPATYTGAPGTTLTLSQADRSEFLGGVVERYFRTVSAAMRKHDPNHLFLGSRFHGAALRQNAIFKAAGPHVDVVSVNYYEAWTPDRDRVAMWFRESGKPCLITEFYVKGMDSGMANNSGAGWIVKTQGDRGLFYQNFALGLLESKTCVGWHWFRYMDNDPTDLTTDPSNRDSNKGIVTYKYKPYDALLAKMLDLNRQVYALADYFDKAPTNR